MNRLSSSCLILLTLVYPTWASAADAPWAISGDGEPFRGTLLAVDAQGTLQFDSGAPAPDRANAAPDRANAAPDRANTVRKISGNQLVLWGAFVEPQRGMQIFLAGGGIIVADTARIEMEHLRGLSALFDKLDLPLGTVAGIVFRPPFELRAQDKLAARIAAGGGQTDRVLLDNGDELTGAIAGLDSKLLKLETDAGHVDVEVDKIAAVIFNPTLLDKLRPGSARTLVGYRDGSRLPAISLAAAKGVAVVKLAGGAELKSPTDAIVALQPLGGIATYLSDLKPTSYRHIPYLEMAWPYRADRSVLGGQLRCGGNLYLKGLGMHSPSRITYDLDQPYRRFQAELAIDAEAVSGGSAVFRVFTDDGTGKWQQRATSETVRGGEAPLPISVDLQGAKRISLLVDFADRGDELDHADWLNARLVR